MEHPAFAEAGQSTGLEIWVIDNFEPVAVDPKLFGKFYNGNSYIVLKTTYNPGTSYTYDAHFWLGSKTTQDKKGSAAILTVTLDGQLGGSAVQHREVQGHESSQFVRYFSPAIRYLEGGNESGFNEVETNAGADKRLLRLSGCDNMRIEEVPAESTSLSKDHCYILEVDHDIFVLMPEGAKATQRRKIISYANKLRDDEHNGRATIEIIDEFSSDDDFDAFFAALGSGSRDDIADDDSTETFARDGTTVYLYKVLDGDEHELVAINKPFKQKHLETSDVYVLDTPDAGVFVWLGQETDSELKKNYFDLAQKYLDQQGYPAWTIVTRISEGSESSTFKQYFHNWDTISSFSSKALVTDSDAGYFSTDADESAATAKMIGKSAAARGYMPDQGEGNLVVTRFSGDQDDITEKFMDGIPIFYDSEVYVVKYQYSIDDADAYVIYNWIGSKANEDDKTAAWELVDQLEAELEGSVNIVKVPQGKEPKHLLNIFKGNLAILIGSKENEYKAENSNGSYDDDHVRLFKVEGTELGVDMRALQVPETASELEDDDVYVLETETTVYIRNGKEANDKERELAVTFVQSIVGDRLEVTTVEQGEEPDDFWAALGGQPDEKEDASGWTLAVNRRVTAPNTLTAVTVNVRGKIRFEELDLFTQEDLSDDGVSVLDTGEELYLWQGTNAPERVIKNRIRIIQEYIKDDGLDRTMDSALVVVVKQAAEPKLFKKLFPSWSDDMWENQTSYEDLKNETKSANSK